jgi:hypothetical protein
MSITQHPNDGRGMSNCISAVRALKGRFGSTSAARRIAGERLHGVVSGLFLIRHSARHSDILPAGPMAKPGTRGNGALRRALELLKNKLGPAARLWR